jgi:hypothetical protein
MNDTVSEERARGIEAALDEARHWDEGFTSLPREYQVLRIVGDEVETISRHPDRASMEAALSEARMSACIRAYLAATKPPEEHETCALCGLPAPDGYVEFDADGEAMHPHCRAAATKPPLADVTVKALEWDDDGDWDGDECAADTLAGTYFIFGSVDVPGKHRVVLNYPMSGQIYQTQLIDGIDHLQGRAFAQVDYEQRILSALASPPMPGRGEPEAVTQELVTDLVRECERAMKQRDEALADPTKRGPDGRTHDTTFEHILRQHLDPTYSYYRASPSQGGYPSMSDKVWLVTITHAGDKMILTFTSENDHRLFMQNIPEGVAITDIQERASVGYITAMEAVAEFAAKENPHAE